jgi:hypothetical protein
MKSHIFSTIDSAAGEIRLLILHPASEYKAELVCELRPVLLSDQPDFESLSYTWGDVDPSNFIQLNGERFQLRENVAAALRYLRLPKTPRSLWVDATCINQDDVAERAQQVLLMQKIYGHASQVCIWLGELSDGAKIAFRSLQGRTWSNIWQQYKVDRKRGNLTSPWKFGLVRVMSFLALGDEAEWGELRELLDRPWWRRTWAFQEAVLARKTVLMCGSETASWESVQTVIEGKPMTPMRGLYVNEADYFPDEAYRRISEYRQRLRDTPEQVQLLGVLYKCRNLECVDPRDKIYGFLGIVPSTSVVRTVPDYQSPVADVYLQFTYSNIRQTRSVDIFNYRREWLGVEPYSKRQQAYSIADQARYHDTRAKVRISPESTTSIGWARLPEGWEHISGRKTKTRFRDLDDGRLYKKSPLLDEPPALIEAPSKQRALPKNWIKRWDNLGRASISYEKSLNENTNGLANERATLEKALAAMPSWVPNWASPSAWDPVPLIDITVPQPKYCASGGTEAQLEIDEPSSLIQLDGLLYDEIDRIAVPWHPGIDEGLPFSRNKNPALMEWEALALEEVEDCPYTSVGRPEALWRSLIADSPGDDAVPEADGDYVELWYDRNGWLKERPHVSRNSTIKGMQQYYAALSSTIYDMIIEFHRIRPPVHVGPGPEDIQLTDSNELVDKYSSYMKRIHEVCAHRALYVTKKGFIGLAPWNAKPGDAISVLKGGKTLYLLRSNAGAGTFSLVGETYVSGLMGGEALQPQGHDIEPATFRPLRIA